jgi:hypothetical protein
MVLALRWPGSPRVALIHVAGLTVLGVVSVVAVVVITFISGNVPHDLVSLVALIAGLLVRDALSVTKKPRKKPAARSPRKGRRSIMPSVLLHRSQTLRKALDPNRQLAELGGSPHVRLFLEADLQEVGAHLGQAVKAAAETDWQRVADLFGETVEAPPITVIIERLSRDADGTGGAWHESCESTVLHADADLQRPHRTSALWIAEFVEAICATQNYGWDCGNTNGEGLSRVVAEWAYPGALQDYSSAAAWLDGGRPNYVDQQQGTDTDELSNGCAVLYLHWLLSRGHDLATICQTGGDILAATGTALEGDAATWPRWKALVDQTWPPDRPSGVTTDNPWPAVAPPPPPPTLPSGGIRLTLGQNASAGNYVLVPEASVQVRLGVPKLSPGQFLAVLQLLGELYKLVFPDSRSGAQGG